MNYLDHFSETEIRQLPEGTWDRAVVLPLYGEKRVEPLLESLGEAAEDRVLAIAVVNARENCPDEVHRRNRALLDLPRHRGSLEVHVVDRASQGRFFPPRQGVGLARKIGCDMALALFREGRLRSPMITTTDGDARVEKDYFHFLDDKMAAGYFDYLHAVDDEESFPLLLYEIWLRYYVQGLRWAGSPYAFPTVGSTMAIHLDAYEKARGFPRRDAGEDFYLFNKLAKVGEVRALPSRVHLRYRLSQRVPFGTGAGTRKIKSQLEGGRTLQLFPPQIFAWLREWLRELDGFPSHREVERVRAALPEFVGVALTKLGAWEALSQAALTRPRDEDCRRALREWFDAFRTLKFGHHLRDESLPEVDFREALREAPFAGWDAPPRELLERLRQNDNAVHFPGAIRPD